MGDTDWVNRFTAELQKKEGDLADRFFEKSDNAVDFEIALAALLATLCLQYPVNDLWIPISQLSAFTLLVVTLGRRIAVSSPYASNDILRKSVVIVEIATTSCLLSIFASAIHHFQVGFISNPSLFVILSFPTMFCFAAIHELIFRDYLIWWHAKFIEKAESESHFDDIWLMLSIVTLTFSKYYRDRPNRERFRNDLPSQDEIRSKLKLPWKKYVRLVARVGLLLLLVYFVPIVPSVAIFGVVGLAVIPTVIAVHDHSAFWYIGYGDTSYEEFRRRP